MDEECITPDLLHEAVIGSFKVCADAADQMASDIAAGFLLVDGATACRVLATVFRNAAAETPRLMHGSV